MTPTSTNSPTITTPPLAGAPPVIDLAAQTRPDFPLLAQTACLGQPLIYLDYAATSQKPRQVLEALQHYYSHDNANVHRGAHQLSVRATEGFEGARAKAAAFVGAISPNEIVFTRNASEAINLVAYSFARPRLKPGDEILVTHMEHHSNIVPWHFHRERKGAVIRWAPVDGDGNFLLDAFEALLNENTKIVAITHMSNVLGTVTPIKEIIRLAHARGIPVMVVNGTNDLSVAEHAGPAEAVAAYLQALQAESTQALPRPRRAAPRRSR
jgi:cysteine desulfurase/selenocysteine lyase